MLTETLKATSSPSPTCGKEFEALARVPVMVIRGGTSDLLSAATVDAMQGRHAGLEVLEVPDEGHAPLLEGPDVIRRIAAFIAAADLAWAPQLRVG